jgi:DNA-binding NarL/FixJ family response regulator
MADVRIVLVADDDLVRGGIRAILSGAPPLRIVGEAGSVGEACRLGLELDPTLFVVDGPAAYGTDVLVEMVRQLGASGRDELISVLLLRPDASLLDLDVLRLDGCAVMPRRTAATELVAAVRLIVAGYLPIERTLAHRLAHTGPQMVEGAARPQLTRRERQIFHLIARGMSNAEIAATLTVASSTVKSHVQDIFSKLGLRNRVQAVIYAYESGQGSTALSHQGV